MCLWNLRDLKKYWDGRKQKNWLLTFAEGFERKSNKEFKQFLFIAKGSAGEVRSMLLIASELGYIEKENQTKLVNSAEEISKILSGLIKAL